MTDQYDVVIVGGGCVGLSIAYHLADRTALDVCVLEKEYQLAVHQSGRNSGVLFPGFLYDPGSRKAALYREGARRAKRYCHERGIPLNECGQLFVARTDDEASRLRTLDDRAAANDVETEFLQTADAVTERQPRVAGQAGLWCPSVATVDSQGYVHALARGATDCGIDLLLGHEVTGIDVGPDSHRVRTSKGDFSAEYVVNAAGLYADKLARDMGVGREFHGVPFRGEYYELVVDRRDLVETVVYPTPDPSLPYLGAHFMPLPDGRVIVGPNAVLAFGREGYSNTDVDLTELIDTALYRGFWRLVSSREMLRAAWNEFRKSLSKHRFVVDAQDLLPALRTDEFVRSYAGVRTELVRRDGTMVEDLTVRWSERTMHVLNPLALTTSLPVGERLADELLERAR